MYLDIVGLEVLSLHLVKDDSKFINFLNLVGIQCRKVVPRSTLSIEYKIQKVQKIDYPKLQNPKSLRTESYFLP